MEASWRRSNLQGWLTQFLWNMLFRTPAVLAGRFAVLVPMKRCCYQDFYICSFYLDPLSTHLFGFGF